MLPISCMARELAESNQLIDQLTGDLKEDLVAAGLLTKQASPQRDASIILKSQGLVYSEAKSQTVS